MITDTSSLVAHLNDLLQLDMDAIAAYQVALAELDSPRLTRELENHLADHERHVTELERHIEHLGGMKMPMPHLTGAFKLAAQGAVAAGSDRAVLLAFKANEMQARDKYQRATTLELPDDVAETVRMAANDERRHYEWAVRSLQEMGASEDDTDVRFAKGFAHVHGRMADGVEAVERGMMHAAEKTRQAIRKDPVRTLATAGLAVIGAGVVLGALARRR